VAESWKWQISKLLVKLENSLLQVYAVILHTW
jgi:hypothetical protein